MNNALITYRYSILLFNGVVELHYMDLIWTAEQYDKVELYALNYLHCEGFLENHEGTPYQVNDVQIFDLTGKRVTREQLI